MDKSVNYMSDDALNSAYGSSDLLALMHSSSFLNSRQNYKLPMGIASGMPLVEDLTAITHLLITGSPASGKTSFIQSLLMALMLEKQPEEFAFACYDSRKSEYAALAENPYCMFLFDSDGPVSSVKRLKEKVHQVHKDYPQMEMVIVLDDYGKLLTCAGGETAVMELLKLSSYDHAHVFLVTSEASGKVITPEIRSLTGNMICFRSPKNIVGLTGIRDAEFLAMPGEAIILWKRHLCRCNTVYADPSVILSVNNELIQKKERVLPDPLEDLDSYSKAYSIDDILGGGSEDPEDALYEEAASYVISLQKASTALLQKRFSISTNRAQKLIDLLEARGVIGPERGSRPRAVYSWREEKAYRKHPSENSLTKHYGKEQVCWIEGDRVRIEQMYPSVAVNRYDYFANPPSVSEDLSVPLVQIEKVTFKRSKNANGYIHIYFMPGNNDVGLSGVIEDVSTENSFDIVIPFSPEKEEEFIEFGKQLMKKAKCL